MCITLLTTLTIHAKQWSLETDVDAGVLYNDNIFMSSGTHDAVSGVIITPTLSGIVKEQHWQANLDAMFQQQYYSDHTLDGSDQFFSLGGQYNAERNIFSLTAKYDLGSNLNSTSTDFGIAGRRINTIEQSVTPQYTRLINERMALTLSYAYTDIDFEDAERTPYTPYITQSGSVSLIYNLTEKNRLTLSVQGVDYQSQNNLITYKLYTSNIGLEHEFSETLSTNISLGVSRQKATNLTTQTFDFFGQPVTVTQALDSENRSSVYNGAITKLLENAKIEGGISRNIRSNSFGGLDRVDQLRLEYSGNISSLWRYAIRSNYQDIKSSNTGGNSLSRELFTFETKIYYSFSTNWNLNASYRYSARKYKSDTSGERAPHSNRLYIGLSYNFPSISTF